METESKLRLADVFVTITDPRQAGKVEHDLVELLVVAVNAVLVGADTFVEIELWAKEKLDWLRGYLKLEAGIPSHDTFGRLFGVINPDEFEAAFRRWVGAILPTLGADTVVAIDGKTSRRSSNKVDATPLHLVSAFAAGAGLVLGQRATAEKSNEKTAIPELLATLALDGCIVTIDAMGTQANIAQAIRDRGADYILAVKDNQPTLAASMRDFFVHFRAQPARTPHTVAETVEKMEAAGLTVADWVKEMLATGHSSFYQNGCYYDFQTKQYVDKPTDRFQITVVGLHTGGKEIARNDSASLLDMGDGVALLEFHAKMNAIDGEIVAMANTALARLDKDFDALVIGNNGQDFCVGANIAAIGFAAAQGLWSQIDESIHALQDITFRLRHAPKPVVTAPHQRVLGGGVEFAMAG